MCQSQNNHNVFSFGVKQKMQLGKGEKLVNGSRNDIRFFEENCKTKSGDLILNKIFTGDHYRVFISVAFDIALPDFRASMDKDSTINIFGSKFFELNNVRDFYKSYFYKKDTTFIFRTIYNELSVGNIVV